MVLLATSTPCYPHAAVSKSITARGEWGVRYSAYGLPGFASCLTDNAGWRSTWPNRCGWNGAKITGARLAGYG